MSSRTLELLAPARDLAAGLAALDAGADAVYIGGPAFGARAAAGNSLEDVAALCARAHLYGARVRLTLNTLLYDRELEAVQELLDRLAETGVDALIIQDPAVFSLKIPAGMELHASTQCLINSVERLRFYRDAGCALAVLPRELSLSEIRRLSAGCPGIRLEAFVAGALCVSDSGCCFISEELAGRSANRGRCAQLCRLKARLCFKGREVASGHLLSLRDNLALPALPGLIEAGVTSFKIEGRLKDEAYVINQTAFWRSELDKLIARSAGRLRRLAGGTVHLNFRPDPRRTFNRSFTCAWLQGKAGGVSEPFSPKCRGVPAGVIRSVRGRTAAFAPYEGVELHNGDGLSFESGGRLLGVRVNRVRPGGFETAEQSALRPGMTVWRNRDAAFLKSLKNGARRILGYAVTLDIGEKGAVLSCADELGRSARLTREYPYGALSCRHDAAALREALAKRLLKDTAPLGVTVTGDPALLRLPLSELSRLRRALLARCFAAPVPDREERPYRQHELPAWPDDRYDPRLCLNGRARALYRAAAPLSSRPLMSCRFCLIRAYGRCAARGGDAEGWTLTLGGTALRVRCDPKRCRMLLERL